MYIASRLTRFWHNMRIYIYVYLYFPVIGKNAHKWNTLQAKHGCRVTFEPRNGEFVCVVRGTAYSVEECVNEIELIAEQSETIPTKKPHRRNLPQNKYLACAFCHEVKRHRIVEHLERVHSNEVEVAAALALPKKSKERMEALNLLKNRGNFIHNTKVLRGEATGFIPARRKEGDIVISQYLPCVHCLGFFSNVELWRHVKYHCPQRPRMVDQSETRQKTSITSQAKILLSSAIMPNGAINAELKLINDALIKAHDDEIKANIVNDFTLKKVGGVLLNKLGERRRNCVMQRLRQLARLKIECKAKGIRELIKGSSFDVVIRGVKDLVEEDVNEEGITIFKNPCLAITLGNNMKKVASILAGEAVREDNQQGLTGKKLLCILFYIHAPYISAHIHVPQPCNLFRWNHFIFFYLSQKRRIFYS